MYDRLLKRACYSKFFNDFMNNPIKGWELCVSDEGYPYLWNHTSYPTKKQESVAQARVVNNSEIDLFFVDLDMLESLDIGSNESHGMFAVPVLVVVQICFGLIGEKIKKISDK